MILRFLSILSIIITTIFSTSCSYMWEEKIKNFRKGPKDPELIGEWLDIQGVDSIKAFSAEKFEKLIDSKLPYYVGKAYRADGYKEAFYLHYSKDSEYPELKKVKKCGGYYTKDGMIHQIYCGGWGEGPYSSADPYKIQNDTLFENFFSNKSYVQHKKQPITVDLFPKKKVK